MRTKTGVSTRLGAILPGAARLSTVVGLSQEAKLRLRWLDYYHAHERNARLTCRHFGICHRTFYRYYRRWQAQGLPGLEGRSHRPRRVRQPTTPTGQVLLVRRLRTDHPEYSKYKLCRILARDHGMVLSASTIGRIISRYRLFFTPPVKPKRHPGRVPRKRKPQDLKVESPGDLVEADVKHLPVLGEKRYAFVALDVAGKRATIHVASTVSSRQAAIAWHKTCVAWGLPEAALTDNGSENLGAFAALLAEQRVTHYFARPRTPKDKPHVERFIGSLERECIQWGGLVTDLADQQAVIDAWLAKYHTFRPHAALDYLTPDEYKQRLTTDEVALIP